MLPVYRRRVRRRIYIHIVRCCDFECVCVCVRVGGINVASRVQLLYDRVRWNTLAAIKSSSSVCVFEDVYRRRVRARKEKEIYKIGVYI